VDGLIRVKLHYTGLLAEASRLDHFTVSDNGTGFDDANFSRFQTLLDRSKGYNNRGTGRIQYLHRAALTEVTSRFAQDGKIICRHFRYDATNYVSNETDSLASPDASIGSEVTLFRLKYSEKELEDLNAIDARALKNVIRQHFILRLYLDSRKSQFPPPVIRVSIVKAGTEQGPEIIGPEDIPEPQNTGDLQVPYVRLKDSHSDTPEWIPIVEGPAPLHWAHFRMAQEDLPYNEVALCSKNVIVQDLPLREIKKTDTVDGHRFLTAVYGDLLDDPGNVSHAVDSFTFPRRQEIEKRIKDGDMFVEPDAAQMFFENVAEGVRLAIPRIYAELHELQEKQDSKVEEIARTHGIPLSSDFDSYPLKMGLKAALCRWKTRIWLIS
jgi:hypothetical protein